MQEGKSAKESQRWVGIVITVMSQSFTAKFQVP